MDNVTYIIVAPKYEKEAFKETLDSVGAILGPDDSVIVATSHAQDVENLSTDVQYSTFVTNEESVYSIVNEVAMVCTTEYFSIIEQGEVYQPYWRKCAEKYNKNYSVLLPLVRNTPKDDKHFLSNELAWSALFSEDDKNYEIGSITFGILENYMDFAMSGVFVNTEDFISLGKFKPSLKIASWYEFLLRCAHKSKRIYVVPKIGVVRPVVDGEPIEKDEADWLIKTAKQEYFFTEDRGKKFKEK